LNPGPFPHQLLFGESASVYSGSSAIKFSTKPKLRIGKTITRLSTADYTFHVLATGSISIGKLHPTQMSNRSVFDVASLFHPNLCQQAVKTATVAHWDVGAKPSRAARCAQRESTANNSTSRLHVASAQMWPPTPIHQVLVPLPAQCARPPSLQHHLAKPAVSWLGCTPVFLRVPEGTPACAFMIPATEPCMSTRDTRRILYAMLAALVVCLYSMHIFYMHGEGRGFRSYLLSYPVLPRARSKCPSLPRPGATGWSHAARRSPPALI
jgi:hypothetical protein